MAEALEIGKNKSINKLGINKALIETKMVLRERFSIVFDIFDLSLKKGMYSFQ